MLYSILPHYFKNCTIFEKKKKSYGTYIVWFDITKLSKIRLKICIDILIKYILFSDVNVT
jgi:hypothetical protein